MNLPGPGKAFFLAILLLSLATAASAESFLEIEDAWVRQPPPGASVAGAYLTIINPTNDDYYITGVHSDRFGAIELHETVEDNGMGRMIHHNYYRIPANSKFEAKPGSYHLMLFRWEAPLKEGEKIEFNLQQGNGDSVPFTAIVKRP